MTVSLHAFAVGNRLKAPGFCRAGVVVHEFAFALGIGDRYSHAGKQARLTFLGAFAIVGLGDCHFFGFSVLLRLVYIGSLLFAVFQFRIATGELWSAGALRGR